MDILIRKSDLNSPGQELGSPACEKNLASCRCDVLDLLD